MPLKEEIKKLITESALSQEDKAFWLESVDKMPNLEHGLKAIKEMFENEKDASVLAQATQILKAKLAYMKGETQDTSEIESLQHKLQTNQ